MQLLESDNIQICQTRNGTRSKKAAWLWRFTWATHWYGSFILPHFAVNMLESSTKKWIFSSFINQNNMSCIWMAIFPFRSSEGNILPLYVSFGKLEEPMCQCHLADASLINSLIRSCNYTTRCIYIGLMLYNLNVMLPVYVVVLCVNLPNFLFWF